MSSIVTMMAQEIAEQPQAVRRTLDALLPQRDAVRELFTGRRRVLFVSRGSSSHAAILGRYLLEARAGISAGQAAPSIATHYRAELELDDTLLVAISQSGATEEIVATARWARERGAAVVAVTNMADSPLATGADVALVTRAGEERAVPATKSHLTQLAAVAVLADALGAGLEEELGRVVAEVERLVDSEEVARAVEAALPVLQEAEHVVVTGRGVCLGTALETALKIEETCLVPVRGYSYADLRHGPISVIDPGVVAVVVAAMDGPMAAPLAGLATDLRERGATVVGIGGGAAFAEACQYHLPGTDLPEPLAPLGLVVPAQLLVERLATALGHDPDNPRGLAKITRTDTH